MTVNVLGTPYTVKAAKLPRGLYGDCDPEKKIIRIDPRKGQFNETLVNEVIHAALFESGLVHILHQYDGLEESIVRAIEHGLRTADLLPEVVHENVDNKMEENSQG